MVKNCAVPICKSRTGRSPNVSFHEFPVDSRRSIWIKNMKRDSWTPTDCSFVCSLHFEESSFKSELKYKRLCPDAVPTLFLDNPTHLQPQISGESEKPKMPTERSVLEQNPNVSVFKESNEGEHIDIKEKHGLKNYPCKICGRTFQFEGSLKKHYFGKTHKMAEPIKKLSRNYKCKICNRIFKAMKTLSKHHRHAHVEKSLLQIQMSTADNGNSSDGTATHHLKNTIVASVTKDISESEEDMQPEDLSCKECGKSYRQLQHLESHIALVHPTNNTGTFKCEICNSTFRNSTVLKKHNQVKHEARNYPCEFADCGKRFLFQNSLEMHVIKAHRDRKLQQNTVHKIECEICNKKFKRKKTMLHHKHRVHGDQLNTQCQFCQLGCFGLKGLQNHLQAYHSDQLHALKQTASCFKCEMCGKKFLTNRSLKLHQEKYQHVGIKDVSSTDNKLIPCETCNMSFRSAVEKTKHRNEQKAQTIIQCIYCLNTFDYKCHFYTHHHQCHQGKKPLLKCTKCDAYLTDYSLLQTHFRKCLSINPENSASSFSGAAIIASVSKNMMESEEPEKVEEDIEPEELSRRVCINLSCGECGKSYSQLQHLKSHIALAHNQKKPTATETFKCEICNSTFRNSALLTAHIQQMHEAKNYVCEFVTCGKAYRSESDLHRHQIRMHKEVWKLKPITVHKHECEFCNKKFKLKKNMDQHQYIAHAKQLNSQCQFCQTRCRGPKGLQNHLRKLHSDQLKVQEQMRFKCEICGKRFLKNKALKRHQKNVHPVRNNDVPTIDKETIPCETCNVSFKSEEDKIRHRDEQKALTVIQCNYCLNTFNYKCQFYAHHHQYHKEKKPLLKCTLCETYVTDYCLLQTHDWKCHSINPENSASSFFSSLKMATEGHNFNNDNNAKESDECFDKNNVNQKQADVSILIDDIIVKVEPEDYQFKI